MSDSITEAYALKKWCPFARATLFVAGDDNADGTPTMIGVVAQGSNRMMSDLPNVQASIQRLINEGAATRCIGSDCMAWRETIPGYNGSAAKGRCGMVST